MVGSASYVVILHFQVFAIIANCVGSMMYIKQISLIMRTIKDLIFNLVPFWAVFMCCYYSFGVLGMIFFEGVIKHDKHNEPPARPSDFPTIQVSFAFSSLKSLKMAKGGNSSIE